MIFVRKFCWNIILTSSQMPAIKKIRARLRIKFHIRLLLKVSHNRLSCDVVIGSPFKDGMISSISKLMNCGSRREKIFDAVANITDITIRYQYFLKYFANTPYFGFRMD